MNGFVKLGLQILFANLKEMKKYCMNPFTPGLNLNLGKSQCTGSIDSANNAVLSADFKNVIFKMIHLA